MKLSFQHFDLPLARSWATARGKTDVAKVVVVELTDKDGIIGRGEAAPISRYRESVASVEIFLKRLNPLNLSSESITQTLTYIKSLAPGEMSAKCAIDIALLDIAAKRARKPLYDFLNLGFREKHHVTSFSIGLSDSLTTRENVLAAADYPILKMKLGGPQDKASWQALREVAPTKLVRADANEAWRTKEEALRNIEWLAGDKYVQFVEQPLPASTPPEDWIWLKQRSPLPIFADESHHSAAETALAAECFHGVNIKLVKSGGVTEGFEALQAARKAGLKTMLGCMVETSVLISAGAHLAELCDYLDLDGNLLITDDPFAGVTARNGVLSFADAKEKFGLRVKARNEG